MRNRQARYMVISFIVAAGAMLLADLIREQGELVVYFAEAFRYGAWYGFRQVGLYFLPGVLLILPITIYLLNGIDGYSVGRKWYSANVHWPIIDVQHRHAYQRIPIEPCGYCKGKLHYGQPVRNVDAPFSSKQIDGNGKYQ